MFNLFQKKKVPAKQNVKSSPKFDEAKHGVVEKLLYMLEDARIYALNGAGSVDASITVTLKNGGICNVETLVREKNIKIKTGVDTNHPFS